MLEGDLFLLRRDDDLCAIRSISGFNIGTISLDVDTSLPMLIVERL